MTRPPDRSDDGSGVDRFDDGTATLRLRQAEKSAVVNRRGVLWRAGLATAVGAGALTALDQQRADAATGGPFVLGQANDAASVTALKPTVGLTTGFSQLMSLDGSAGITVSTLDVTGPSGGNAVFAHVDTGVALAGSGTGSATGVSGASSSGTGVNASSVTGTALQVSGKTHFSRSGSASVAQGSRTKSVTVSGMTSSSLVLVTLQVSVSGLYVAGAVPATGKFTLHLNKAAPTKMKFAWFVLSG